MSDLLELPTALAPFGFAVLLAWAVFKTTRRNR